MSKKGKHPRSERVERAAWPTPRSRRRPARAICSDMDAAISLQASHSPRVNLLHTWRSLPSCAFLLVQHGVNRSAQRGEICWPWPSRHGRGRNYRCVAWARALAAAARHRRDAGWTAGANASSKSTRAKACGLWRTTPPASGQRCRNDRTPKPSSRRARSPPAPGHGGIRLDWRPDRTCPRGARRRRYAGIASSTRAMWSTAQNRRSHPAGS